MRLVVCEGVRTCIHGPATIMPKAKPASPVIIDAAKPAATNNSKLRKVRSCMAYPVGQQEPAQDRATLGQKSG